MTLEKAKRIEYLRTGPRMHSERRIAEIIEEEFPECSELCGNQLWGHELLLEALETIYNKSIIDIDNNIREKWDR